MFWLRGCNLRTLKKYDVRPYQDGVLYTWKSWATLMEMIGKLKPGHIILNPYSGQWQKIKEIEFFWEPINRRIGFNKDRYLNWLGSSSDEDEWPTGRTVGHVINEFIIYTEGGGYVYDIEHHHWWWKKPLDPQMLTQFNRQIGKPDDYAGPWKK